MSLMAQRREGFPRPSGAGGAVRLAVAHQHVGSWCLGYLHVSGDEVWYEVVKPTRYQEHAFRIERSQITALRQWVLLGQPQNATEIKSGRATYHFWLLADQELSHASQLELQTPAAMPYQVLISAIESGGNRMPAANASPESLAPPAWLSPGARSSPATTASAGSTPGAQPDEQLKSVLQAIAEYRRHYYQTGDTSNLSSRITMARANAQAAY